MSLDDASPIDLTQLGTTSRGTWPPFSPFPAEFAQVDDWGSTDEPSAALPGALRQFVMGHYPNCSFDAPNDGVSAEASLDMHWGYLHGSEWELAGMTPELRAARSEIISRSLRPKWRALVRQDFTRYVMWHVARKLGASGRTTEKQAEQFQAGISNVALELAKIESGDLSDFAASTKLEDQESDFVLFGLVGRLLKAAKHGFREQYRKGKRVTKADRKKADNCQAEHYGHMCQAPAGTKERPRPEDHAKPHELTFGQLEKTYNKLDEEFDKFENTIEANAQVPVDDGLSKKDAFRVATKNCTLRDVEMMQLIEDGKNQHEVAAALGVEHDSVQRAIAPLRKAAFRDLDLKYKPLASPDRREPRRTHKCLIELPELLAQLRESLQPTARPPE